MWGVPDIHRSDIAIFGGDLLLSQAVPETARQCGIRPDKRTRPVILCVL